MIIPRNKDNIYHFLQYDYVGAPWSGGIDDPLSTDAVGNGGFSLRNRSAMIRLLEENPYPNNGIQEDTYISGLAKYKPPLNKACAFSMESIPCWDSFGLHAPWKHIFMDLVIQVVPNIQELISLQGVEDE